MGTPASTPQNNKNLLIVLGVLAIAAITLILLNQPAAPAGQFVGATTTTYRATATTTRPTTTTVRATTSTLRPTTTTIRATTITNWATATTRPTTTTVRATTTTTTLPCSDSDGGQNLSARGYVSGPPIVINRCGGKCWDACVNSTHVREWYCVGNTPRSQALKCPDRMTCQNGTCGIPCEIVVEFTKRYGVSRYGGSNAREWGASIQQTSDGGYLLIGSVLARDLDTGRFTNWSNLNYMDIWVIKTDAAGNVLWSRYEDIDSSDEPRYIAPTSDGGFIEVGYVKTTTTSGTAGEDVFLIKIDSTGNILWNRTYGAPPPYEERGYSVQQTSDGGFIITGYTRSEGMGRSNLWLIKTDSSGNIVWDKVYWDSVKYNEGNAVRQTSDGGYIIVGHTVSEVDLRSSLWLFKTDSSGNYLWSKTFRVDSAEGYSVQQTSDGGYIISGSVWGSGAGGDIWLIKTDSSGNVIWDVTYTSTASSWFDGSLYITTDGGYVILGYSKGEIYLMKTDSKGNILCDKTLGAGTASSFIPTSDGGYAITGTAEDDVLLIKIKVIINSSNSGYTSATATPKQSTTATTLPNVMTTCNGRSAIGLSGTVNPTTTGWNSVSGSLTSGSDTDKYTVTVTAAGTYQFSLCTADAGSASYDSYLCLYDSSGRQLASNDDYCGTQSRISYYLNPGTYYIQVSAYSSNYGSYTLAYRR